MEENKSSVGSIIGTIIIIAIIILGGLYFWGKRIEENKAKENLITTFSEPSTNSSEANAISSVTAEDDLNSIEADLNATNFDNLDAELNSEAELE
ncbi:MAG: hypothetical protein A2566_02990 [Candidatus Zambryskibacteria bacterium RIFOXYD1_FULL_40_13]|nr:MAG: hypothetical protein UT25_C0002G0086 [Parcubacteria group bacterium GW2011_GWC1_39_12]KKR19415.1 MAG: hypothetical protein UT49_C0002G0261 [Parcubacteria group bacterium GW2011_GWF1_39_37]KKR35203.1 MAG: hypothetical protein UT68_C0004G0011 [Parcubacteria group bacterium GW2011_GWC2_40_10]KKR52364.1 MAG: hypothetical protein UT89_C0002G0165 [Parcubacteria group bacterium GW2011_GWE1_40_20]KKR65628.1 MAG: hypothetical protein UU06_C0014G0006 [Parcubacteria group bacterium GW2011_GWB1_40_